MLELIVDSFAGGGGASLGIEMALGRSPDIAINHDAEAIAMHAANHPTTRHLSKNVWKVDPLDEVKGRKVGLAWFSPDCKHFSKAKGGKPVSRNIRDLAWVVVLWAKRVRPRVIILENVEEFRTWGPLDENGLPCPIRKGQTFKRWVRELRRLGYAVEWRELRACDFGAPTIRKRLFLIARCDGQPIVWPKPTHAPLAVTRDGIVTAWAKGHGLTHSDLQDLQPYKMAADCIDWTIPCPSIFLTKEEGKAIRVKRPLADATMARIAKGVMRYVIEAASPFIVPITHAGDLRTHAVTEPLRTVTTAHRGEHALIVPHVVRTAHGERDRKGKKRGKGQHAIDEPLPTITASPEYSIVAPVLTGCGGRAAQSPPKPVDEPMNTITAKADQILVAPYLVPRYGERPGQDPRTHAIDEPVPTIVPTGNGGALCAAHLAVFRGGNDGRSLSEPMPTVTANSYIKRPGGAPPQAVVTTMMAPHVCTMRNAEKPFNGADEPFHTVTAGGARQALVAAYLAQHNTDMVGHDAREPVSTIVQKGCTQALVAAHMINLKGSDRRDGPADAPAPSVTAGGRHIGEVRAFLSKYYGPAIGQDLAEPLHTATAKARFGLVTVQGEPYQIVDIGMRMLTRRELFRAQGFPDSYIIDPIYNGKPLSNTASIRMCGNSVSPVMARALVAANYAAAPAEREAA